MTLVVDEQIMSTADGSSDIRVAAQVGALLERYFASMAARGRRVPANRSRDLYGSVSRCRVFGPQLSRLLIENRVSRRSWVEVFCAVADQCVKYTLDQRRRYATLHVNSVFAAV